MRITLLLFAAILFISGNAQDKEYSLDKKYPISKTGTVYLTTDDAKITVQGSDRTDVHVDIFRKVTTKGITWGGGDFAVEVQQINGNLYIKERNGTNYTGVIGYMREDYEVVIEVPRSVSLDLRGDDDDYRIFDVSGAISIDADDADMQLRNCSGKAFRFNIDDGDIDMDKGSGSLELEIDDGDAYIRNGSFSRVDVSMDDGELILETSLDNEGIYEIRGSDGRINFIVLSGGGFFDVSHDDSYVRASSEFKKVNEGEHKTSFELGNGNARIRIRCDDSRVNLSLL